MEGIYTQITELVGSYLPNLLGAIVILVVGWIAALIISRIVKRLLHRTSLDEKLAKLIGGEEKTAAARTEEWIARGVFYLLMLFVLVAFFQTLQLTLITEPVNNLLNQLFEFAPQLLGAGLLILLAWIIATLLKLLVTRALEAVKLDEKISAQAPEKPSEQIGLSKSLAEAVYWLVFLLFLPAILGTLQLQGLLEPIQGMVNEILSFLPNLLTAALIILVGWFVARIIQRIVKNLLIAIGADRLSERIGLTSALGKANLSGVLALIVYIFILVPVIIAALNALALESITRPASNMLNTILAAIPNIFTAILIVGVAYAVGRILSTFIATLLEGVGFDGLLTRMGLSSAKSKTAPSAVVGYVAMIVIIFFAFTEAFNLLGFVTLNSLMGEFAVFAGHIMLGLIIFGLGIYLAKVVAESIHNSQAHQSGLLALVARIAILIFAGAMALRQMGLANEIIVIGFGLIIGAVAVAVAIAFGVGGRDLAAKKLDEWSKTMSK